jgi:DNA-binding FrmR family transcriptional regulator
MKNPKKSRIQTHLRRIIGQLQGLEKMIEARRDCQEIINQLMAARASLERLGILILHDKSSYCFIKSGNNNKKLKELEKITQQLFKIT